MLKKITTSIKHNRYLYFGTQLLIVLLMIWIADFALGSTLRHFYFKQKTGWAYNTTYSMEQTDAKLLIFGSSKGTRQFHPEVFEEKFGLPFYNASREGYFMLYHEAVLNAVLKRYTPERIILDVRAYEFMENKQTYERLDVLLPYYKTHPEIRDIVNLKSKHEKVKLLSSVYPFNSMIFNIASGVLGREKDEVIKGYKPSYNVWKKPVQPARETESDKIDSNFVNSYKAFLQKCKDRNIKITVVATPYLNMLGRELVTLRMAEAIAKAHNIQFIDYTMEPALVSRQELFADPIHLNDVGARLMSAMVADSIIQYEKRYLTNVAVPTNSNH
ncbi:MAG TPA: SGNH/GDSL hydrolase family protein [Ferruginibacter sp.]|nr:SGNH/GDSL hydrolase family protein [Ferruginibacter sp.]HMP20201.1 SGNH/GDSL hydrolase family protein [Ferruginibacter sp.]